jgi:LPS export ABC transporter protein LptC
MSSLTDGGPARPPAQARRAVAWAGLSPYLSWAAALLGLGMVVAFVLQAGLFAYLSPKDVPPPPKVENPGETSSKETTLSGVDKNQQPYWVKARKGWQDPDRPELVHMETVIGQLKKLTGELYEVAANTALYNSKDKLVDLAGQVVISQKDRFTARMEKAHVDVNEKKLTSDVAVAVEFTGGTVLANGLQITGDGADILFLNGVKAHFAGTPVEGGTAP